MTCEFVGGNVPAFPEQPLKPHIWKLPTGPCHCPGRRQEDKVETAEGARQGGSSLLGPERSPKESKDLSVTCCPHCGGAGLWPWSLHMWHPRRCLDLHVSSLLPAPLLRPHCLCSRPGLPCLLPATPSVRRSLLRSLSLCLSCRLPHLHPFLSSGLVLRAAGWSWFCHRDWNKRHLGPAQQTRLERACGGISREG